MFTENHKYKKSMHKERLADQKAQCEDKERKFDVVIKARSPKRKIAIIVSSSDIIKFQAKLLEMQTGSFFKDLLEERRKNKHKKGGAKEDKSA